MTELKFYTDGEHVYLNMDSGITKEVDLSALFKESNSAYDAVISIDLGSYVGTIIKGSYTELLPKLKNSYKVPSFLVQIVDSDGYFFISNAVQIIELQEHSFAFLVVTSDSDGLHASSGWEWSDSDVLATTD